MSCKGLNEKVTIFVEMWFDALKHYFYNTIRRSNMVERKTWKKKI